jgi:putative heme transporter
MSDREPRARPQVTFSTVFRVCLGVAAFVALGFFLFSTRVSLTLALAAAMVAVALNHAVRALTSRGLRRSLAIAAVMLGVAAAVAGLALLIIPPAVGQARALAAEAPAIWKRLQHAPLFSMLDTRLHFQEQLRDSAPSAAGAVTPVLSAIGGAVTALGGLLGFLFLTVFMLIFGGDLVALVLAEVRPDSRHRYERIAASIYRAIGGYLGGLLGICAVNATLTTTFLVIVRTPFFLPLGILSGFSSLVPYAGPLVAGTSVTIFALVTGGAWKALATAIYFVLYGQLEGNVLAPLVYRHTVDVNPLVTLLAILFLAEFMGVFGAIVAVPAAAVAQIIARELLALRRERLAAAGE